MRWINEFLVFLICVTSSIAQDDKKRWDLASNNEALSEEGSGGKLAFSDDEDFGESGSGSGSGTGGLDPDIIIDEPLEPVTSPPRGSPPMTPTHPPTLCEQQRDKHRGLYSRGQPQCTEQGDFEILQCSDYDCWCADRSGIKIPGTVMESPNMPDCETGTNLSPCIYELVQSQRGSSTMSYKPKCSQDSMFQPRQCSGHMCFCVNTATGRIMEHTRVHRADLSLSCEDDDTDSNVELLPVLPEKPKADSTEDDGVDIQIDGNDNGVFEGTDIEEEDNRSWDDNTWDGEIDQPTDTKGHTPDENYSQGSKSDSEVQMKENSVEDQIMTQPGILAGIIGGSVVLLLCLVLLVMFIIYRMRKKDEGSYPMDETNRHLPNYSYHHVRADKEFYA